MPAGARRGAARLPAARRVRRRALTRPNTAVLSMSSLFYLFQFLRPSTLQAADCGSFRGPCFDFSMKSYTSSIRDLPGLGGERGARAAALSNA